MSGRRILVDTSIWIDYFQGGSPEIAERLDAMLTGEEIFVPGIVLAELIQGARSPKEVGVIEEFIEAFHLIDQKENTWRRAGKLSFDLKKKGKTIHLTDCYIAIMAMDHGCDIFTLDKHFKEIQKQVPIGLTS